MSHFTTDPLPSRQGAILRQHVQAVLAESLKRADLELAHVNSTSVLRPGVFLYRVQITGGQSVAQVAVLAESVFCEDVTLLAVSAGWGCHDLDLEINMDALLASGDESHEPTA